jgi:mono/diheme cytochrome c family protein
MRQVGALVVVVLLAAACSKEQPAPPASPAPAPAVPVASMDNMLRGARLFQEHCAQCHGPEAQGHPDWQNPEILAAAPPLDHSGKAWKRRRAELVAAIQNGARRKGEQVMPAWKGRLTDAEVDDIVTWFTALWPNEVYEQWQKANAPAGPGKG